MTPTLATDFTGFGGVELGALAASNPSRTPTSSPKASAWLVSASATPSRPWDTKN